MSTTKTASWMLDADGTLMPPALDLYTELRLSEAQWRTWWEVWDAETTSRTRGRNGVRLLRPAGDPNDRLWTEVVDALIDLERIAETDRDTALKSEWIKYASCPGCGSSGAFLRRDASGKFPKGQVRVSCGRRCRTRDVFRVLEVEWAPRATVLDEREDAQVPRMESGQSQDSATSEKAPKKSTAELLVELAEDRYAFGCTDDGEPYALAQPAGHIVRTLRGGQVSLRAELSAEYRRKHQKVPAQQALADALLVLEGIAQENDPTPVHLRVGTDENGTSWLDLGDKDERAVRIGPGGWQVTEPGHIPVRFRRTKLTGALPVPVAGGDLGELWELLNVAEADRPLLLGWLVAALVRPDIPHPILALFGEQGTGKSTASRLLVSLTDPSPVPLRKPPKDPEGWVTAASGSWVVGLDNLSEVRDWFSDSLCRAATGDGDVRRALYTDGGLAVFAFRRCVVLNGIDLGSMRGDLADRAIVINLDPLTEQHRCTEGELAGRWQAAFPRILGALLDACSEGLARLPSVRLERSPRMADFAAVLAALDTAYGTDGLSRYVEQATTLAEDTLDAEPFLLEMREAITTFTGTAADLLAKVTPDREDWRRPQGWPKDARGVTGILKRNAPALRKSGWRVDLSPVPDPEKRVKVWTVARPQKVRIPSSESSESSENRPAPEDSRTPRTKTGQSQDASAEACTRRDHTQISVNGFSTCVECDAEAGAA